MSEATYHEHRKASADRRKSTVFGDQAKMIRDTFGKGVKTATDTGEENCLVELLECVRFTRNLPNRSQDIFLTVLISCQSPNFRYFVFFENLFQK